MRVQANLQRQDSNQQQQDPGSPSSEDGGGSGKRQAPEDKLMAAVGARRREWQMVYSHLYMKVRSARTCALTYARARVHHATTENVVRKHRLYNLSMDWGPNYEAVFVDRYKKILFFVLHISIALLTLTVFLVTLFSLLVCVFSFTMSPPPH
jgi:hypothetical protein